MIGSDISLYLRFAHFTSKKVLNSPKFIGKAFYASMAPCSYLLIRLLREVVKKLEHLSLLMTSTLQIPASLSISASLTKENEIRVKMASGLERESLEQ